MSTSVPSTVADQSSGPSEQVFVDLSGRRARRVTRCGYVLGLGCVGYIGMVALGLSGTRVAALPGVPTSAEHEIIAGLSGQGGVIGLPLTPVPVIISRTTGVAAAPVHVASHPAPTVNVRSKHLAVAQASTPLRTAERVAQQSPAQARRSQSEPDAPAQPSNVTNSKSAGKLDSKAGTKGKDDQAGAKHSKHSSGEKPS